MRLEIKQIVALVMVATFIGVGCIHLLNGPIPASTVFLYMENGEPVTYTLPFWLHFGLDRVWFDVPVYCVLAGIWTYALLSILGHTTQYTAEETAMSVLLSGPAGLVFGLVFGLVDGLVYGLVGLVFVLVGLVFGLVDGLVFGLMLVIGTVAATINATAGFIALALMLGIIMFLWGIGYGLFTTGKLVWMLVKRVRLAPPAET